MTPQPLLSIAIPSYGRSRELLHSLSIFADQIAAQPPGEIELHVVDDASPDDTGAIMQNYISRFPFMHYHRHPENRGLERNLIDCTDSCRGEYLWIFGDDDFLERTDSLSVILHQLRKREFDFYILNRTRRNADLSRILSNNWMQMDTSIDIRFESLKAFCLRWGLISIIGFISINIFRRDPFARLSPSPYAGTMYPQLGMMMETFHDKPCLLLTQPLVCHRTQTAQEKKNSWGRKTSERDFFGDDNSRNVTHFGIRWIRLLRELVHRGALEWRDISFIPESTVIDGYLVDFLLDNMELALVLGHRETISNWPIVDDFLSRVNLVGERRNRWLAMR
ncbi:MAG: hypothetical protein A2X46_15935 [Lentisphaerae bacterium GWF2_57_35]|nr:MAG: hypothetical protein A2X46_15935 [Lentisphaerae bacterium GWF2_57_35]